MRDNSAGWLDPFHGQWFIEGDMGLCYDGLNRNT